MRTGAVVMHRYWGSPGGGQLVCAAAADALRSTGVDVALSGVFRFDPSQYVRWFGIDISGMRTYTMGAGPRAFGLISRAYAWVPAKRAIRETGAELLFTDEPTYRPLLEEFPGLDVIEYIHFPLEASIDARLRDLGFHYSDDPYIASRYGRFPMNLYWRAYMNLTKRYMRSNPFESARSVLTNSRWTADVIRHVYGEEPIVLNPPLPPSASIPGAPPPFDARRNVVVMLGRFSEEKRYDWVVGELGRRLREMGAKLVIFGGAVTGTQRAYMDRVATVARRAGLSVAVGARDAEEATSGSADVRLVPNAPRDLIDGAIDRSKVFLHATVNEHWGIAVAEAMARGLPAVVHRSGGAWTDLAEEGRSGMGYATPEEAIDAIGRLVSDGRAWADFSSASLRRTGEISLERFERSLLDVIEETSVRAPTRTSRAHS
ncbi:MAG: glycosyltransferase [Conexivisphaera sp.]